MVKGVSKTIIEVNNTGSPLFEKIVFYVTPEFGTLNAKQLKRAASEFSFKYEMKNHKCVNLRKRYKKRMIKRAISILAAAALFLIIGCVIFLICK